MRSHRNVWSFGMLALAASAMLSGACSREGTVTAPESAEAGNPTARNSLREAASPFLPPSDPMLGLMTPFAALTVAGVEATVDDDLVECPDAGFTTIQAAVNSGASDIDVCAGTYPENVTIGSQVKLKGAGTGATMVTGVAATAGPILDVLPGGEVEIRDLTVDGGSAMAGGTVQGIRYTDADGKIEDVEVLNIRNPSGTSQGVGIRVQSSGAGADVVVRHDRVANYTRVGILANGTGANVDLDDNDIDGPTPPTVWAPNGIQISRGATAAVKKNAVDNNPSPNPPGGAGSGILLYCAGPSQVHDNVVTRADLGISISDTKVADVHKNDVSESGFSGIDIEYLGNFFGNLGCPGHPVAPTDNKVHENTVTGGDPGGVDDGIDVVNFDPATNPATPSANEIHNNGIAGVGADGIHVWDGSLNHLQGNRISDSGNIDAVDDTAGGGTAGTANTWKNNRCATSSPPGLCK